MSFRTYILKIHPAAFAYIFFIIAASSAAQEPPDSGMVFIPGGWFMMGSELGEKDERPAHRVFVDGFHMSATEVTIGEYFEAVQAGACAMPIWWNREFFREFYDDLRPAEWFKLPVTGITWRDAMNYCRWKGPGYRLPTEAEWEYAARAGTNTPYFWGGGFDKAPVYANVGTRLCPAGSFRPNAFGLYDMTGNAWEWCADYYSKDYYQRSPGENPEGPATPGKPARRVVRGGNFDEYSWNLRCANRNFGREIRGFRGVGFRIVYQSDTGKRLP